MSKVEAKNLSGYTWTLISSGVDARGKFDLVRGNADGKEPVTAKRYLRVLDLPNGEQAVTHVFRVEKSDDDQ